MNITYLDVSINLVNYNTPCTSVYHKVDDFPFQDGLFTFPDNCIPISFGYNVFVGQVLRYGRICSLSKAFIYKAKYTIDLLLVVWGYSLFKLITKMERILHKHCDILHKFGWISTKQFNWSLLK